MIKRRPARRPSANRPASQSQFAERNRFRRLGHETLEKRELLAADILAIRPDNSALLQDNDVLNVAPREFNLFFKGGANLNEATINANTVRLVRSGGDGVFGNIDDVAVSLGYVGLVNPGTTDPIERQQIVLRPASSASHNASHNPTDSTFAFPDDFYRIEIVGAGALPLASIGGEAFRGGQNFAVNFRLDRGAQVVSVVPQPVTRGAGGVLSQADNQIVVYFDDQLLNLDDAQDPKFFRLVDTGTTLAGNDDKTLLPNSAVYVAATNQVTLTFASAIPEGTYRLDTGLSDGGSETLASAIRVGTLFNQNRFTQNGYVGDINGSNNDAGDLDHYRFELTTGANIRVDLTAHASTLDITARLLDALGNQLATVSSGPGGTGMLTRAITSNGSYFVEVSSTNGSTGSYLIDVTVTGNSLVTNDNNTTFDSATNLFSLGAAGLTLASQIERQNIPLPPWAGGQDEPGHRQIQREIHIPLSPGTVNASGTQPRLPAATRVVAYHFPPSFPNQTAPSEVFLNQITEEEKRIVRTIFDIFASYSGYEFVETPAGGLQIGKTDLRAFSPSIPPGAAGGLGGGAGAIVSATAFQDSDRFFGDGFTGVMFHEIGHSLGLWHSYELPSLMGEGVLDDNLLGDHDIVHLQRLVPPNSTDIDMFRFEVAETGRFSAETIAERLATPSVLDTVLTLYRQNSSGQRELVARNNRYFGNDSFIGLDLEPGVYFIGVSSTGNENYDPNVPNSGYGGTTDGQYELKMSFQANRGGSLRDADGTAMDGNSDGTPGGVHQFWFQASDTSSTIFVDRNNDPLLGGNGGNGRVTSPFDRLSKAIDAAGSRIVVPITAVGQITPGDTFTVNDGVTNQLFTFDGVGGVTISVAALTTAEAIATAIAGAINGSNPLTTTAVANGRIVNLTNLDRLDVSDTATLLNAANLVRIVGNGGTDNNILTPANNRPYLLGTNTSGNPLRDGADFLVPQGVTVMIDAGVLIKLRAANLDAGTSAVNLSRAASAIQVLGTPTVPVWLRSFHDDTMGGNSDGVGPAAQRGDFGGIVFRGDSDLEDHGIFLNNVTHIDVRHGGGRVFVDSQPLVFAPIHLEDSRPTIRFNHIHGNADSAISANPDSFDDSLGRIGPDIVGNYLQQNTIDGLFIRIRTQQGASIDKLTLPGRFDDTDITHVLTENLVISGNPGGLLNTGTQLLARAAGRLVIDPGVVLKAGGSRIEAERGSSAIIAEGTANRPVVFTSLSDDRYGGSGTFDTDSSGFSTGQAGDWAGIYLGHLASGHFDNVILTFGGGDSAIEGVTTTFNVIEAHEATLRITNSLIRDNADGNAGDVRNGRGANSPATIYVRRGQPTIVGNTFIDNEGPVININVNSLNYQILPDLGRASGTADVFQQFADNYGPMVRLNRLAGNSINGMVVRSGELTTESVWDDTDIVHVVQGEIIVDNHHTFSGLRLQSSNSESLVIKLAGANAGFTATGTPLETIDRIGGTIHVLGQPGFPVVMTHIGDDTVGAGFAPDGTVMTNTNNTPVPSAGAIGGWRGLRFDEWSNDRNVAIIRERENPITAGRDLNRTPTTAQQIGTLAPNEKSGDENRRLGFEIHGFISPDDPGDVDVYSFRGTAGTPIWIDVDRTDSNLDVIVEVLNANGTVLARSVRSGEISFAGNLNVQPMSQNPLLGGDFYTQNFRDAGFQYTLTGTPGTEGTYFVRVRSNPQTGPVTALAGKSSGKYQLQIRLQQVDEFPGSTVRYADIRNAQTAVDVRGLPARSPFIAEAGEVPGQGDVFDGALQLVNLLETDMAALGISGTLSTATDVDWFRFSVQHTGIQVIPGVNDDPGTVAVVFDIDYADALNRPDTTVAVYDANGVLVWIGRESNIEDDQSLDATGNLNDLSRGSVGRKDAYIGPIHVRPTGTYYVAVMSNQMLPRELTAFYSDLPTSTNLGLVRLEPVNTVRRIVEDHFGFQGHTSLGAAVAPVTPGIFDISNPTSLDNHVVPFRLQDVVLYVATDNAGSGEGDGLFTVNPYSSERYLTRVTDSVVGGVNDVQDIVIRSDGRMFGYQRLNAVTNTVGGVVEINPSTNATTLLSNDNIPGRALTPNTSGLNPNLGGSLARAEQFTTSDEVDAFTFHRRTTTGPSSAPVPVYDTYLVVRETDGTGFGSNSKLYRGRANGDATPVIAGATPRYGVMGDIQPAGVTYASQTLTVVDGATPANVTQIRIESKLPGNAGNNIVINISRPNDNNANVASVAGTTINLQIGGTGGPPLTGAPTAAAIVDAINGNADARNLVTAIIVGGNAGGGTGNNGTVALGLSGGGSLTGGADGPDGPLAGRVTGLSFGNFLNTGDLFGVTTAGEFLVINPNSGQVIQRVNAANTLGIANLNFQGLALGPQNVNGGQFANTLFATTNTGSIVAFDLNGNGVTAFDSGNAAQLVTVTPATANPEGFFTLTFNNGTVRRTTVPISVNAPSIASVNEQQSFDTNAFGGTFTASFVRNQGAVSNLSAPLTLAATTFTSDGISDLAGTVNFPGTPFVIRVQNEAMLVTARAGNNFTVIRGINGTTATAHPDTATVFEVVTTSLVGSLGVPTTPTFTVMSSANLAIDNLASSTALTVASAAGLPTTPFFIRVDREDMLVTNVTGNTLTVARAQNGTAIVNHLPGRPVQVVSDSITVLNATPMPASGFNIRINGEDMRVVNRIGNQLNVVRGHNGTVMTTHTGTPTVFRIDTTTAIPFNATAAQVRTAIGALPSVGGIGNVVVTGGPLSGTGTTPVSVTFQGALAAKNLQPLTYNTSGLIGDEIQQIALTPGFNVTGGTFQLRFTGIDTIPIPFNATAAQVQNALNLHPTIGFGNAIATGGALPGTPVSVQFTGLLQDSDIALLQVMPSGLTFNERQQVRVFGNPTGGTFTLNINDAVNGIIGSSLPIASNATAVDIATAITSGIPALVGNIIVTGTDLPAGTIVVEFINTYANIDVSQFTFTNAFTGGAAPTANVTTLAPITVSTVRVNQFVSVNHTNNLNGILSVRDALVGLPTIGPGDIRVTGNLLGAGVLVNFQGALAGLDFPDFDVDNFLTIDGSQAAVTSFGDAGDGGADSSIMSVTGLGNTAIGLAFSPLDFNLWHPTMRRSSDAGHGILAAPDDSRFPGAHDVEVPVTGGGEDRSINEGVGGVSMHFGFEQWSQSQNSGEQVYLPMNPGANTQLGILNTVQHQDLSSNASIVGTYNFPGGALGSLVSSTFSLAGSIAQDRPTMYFNYFLNTEQHLGSDVSSDGIDPFRDSARVFASRDGGTTWELLATNNSDLSGNSPTNTSQRAELAGFLSPLSDAGLNSDTPRAQSHQIVQELFDNTGQWRQARVDLSTFAGASDVILRFDFTTAGAMRDASLGFTDANFGEFTSDTRSIRSSNNAFEGFYIDDIIVGYAERGEMVTGVSTPERLANNLAQAGSRTRDNDPARFANSLTGAYQLEIRRTDDVAAWVEDEGIALVNTFNTNDRHINTFGVTATQGFEGTVPASTASNAEIATLIEDLTGTAVPPAAIPILIRPWGTTTTNAISGLRSLASPAVFNPTPAFPPGLPPFPVAAIYQQTPASLLSSVAGRGLIRFKYSVSSLENTHGLLFLIDDQPQLLVPGTPGGEGGVPIPPNPLASGERREVLVEFPFDSGQSTLTWVYLFAEEQNTPAGDNRAWIDDIEILQGDRATGFEADRNRPRPQGVFIVEANTITNSAIRGINVQPGTTQGNGSVPHPGSTINFPNLNNERLVPGIVIQNNIIAGSSGILFAGESTVAPQRPVPFGRIVNNTLVGNGGGVGVQVGSNASPTILNNIITRFGTGIINASGAATVVRSNYFQANGANGPTGTDSIIAAPGTPLFLNNDSFYLVPGSTAVDSSLDTQQDRFNFVNFKAQLGIPASPISAPEFDVYGQKRVDSGQSPGGGGASVFKDRGAVDRSDSDAPFAILLDPIDNDISGIDQDPNLTVVSLPDPIVEAFSILLADGRGPNAPFEGTGVDPTTVSSLSVTVRRNNVTLTAGVDYVLGYNTSTSEMRLTPLSTLWEPAGVYEIILDNTQIRDRAGNLLRANQPDGSTRFWIILPSVGLDYGDAPNSFGTLLASDGARHALINDATPRLGRSVDDEADGSTSDDLPANVTLSSPSSSAIFVITGSGTPSASVTIDPLVAPLSGDKLTVNIGSAARTFELVPIGVAPGAGNVAIRFLPGETAANIATKLATSIGIRLGSSGQALAIAVNPLTPETITIENLDDEDGAGIGTLTTVNRIVFLRPNPAQIYSTYPNTTADNADVLGFLNPLDPAGAQIAVTVTGSGFIDAWIDWDSNGVFDPTTEKVLDSVFVDEGVNILTIQTPAGAADGVRWSRLRLSPEGGLQPTGLAVGGEVEDYQVEVISVDLTIPFDDQYTIFEDDPLDTLAAGEPTVVLNDSFATNLFTPFYVQVVDGPQNAASFTLDPATGHFVYEPLADFAGIDTFTYYVAIQQSAIDADITVTLPLIATVTIDVRPVNDAPLAASQGFITLESQPTPALGDPPQVGRGPHPLVITAADLLANARAHQDPQYPVAAPAAPWDETDQSLRVVEIILPDGTIVTAAAANAAGEVTVATVRGTALLRFVMVNNPAAAFVSTLGSFINMTYVSNNYLNRDNVTLQTVVVNGNNVDVFDFVRYTIEDDGLLIDPDTIDPLDTSNVIQDDTFFAGPFVPLDPTNRFNRLRHTSIAVIDVAPQNDHPIPNNDVISVGTIGSGVLNPAGTINPINLTTPWSQFYIGLGFAPANIPVPREDSTIIIPAAFLLRNDFAGQPVSIDENGGINDSNLRVINVSMVTSPASGGGSVSVNSSGNVVFRAPTDYYGEIVFTYVMQDSGIDEDVNGNRAGVSNQTSWLTATGTVTINVQPVNDAPIAFDRDLDFTEAGNPGVDMFQFNANDLLALLDPTTPAVPGTLTPNLVAPFTEVEQALRVVAFTTGQGTVDVANLTNYTGPGTGNGMLVLPSDGGGRFEFDIVNGALTNARFFGAADYNERTPFNALELLRFTIEDNGRTTDPQTGTVVSLPAVRSVNPATLTITVGQTNDAPIFTMPSLFPFNENLGQTVVATNFVTTVAPGPLTALDELQRQNLSFTFQAINVPAGMMATDGLGNMLLPTITVIGGPGNWPGSGTLTVFPASDAFGFAVYRVTATDNDPVAPRSTIATLTVQINPINDVPVTYDRVLNVTEAVEVDGGVALLSFTPARLIQGIAPELPSVDGLFPTTLIQPYNEVEQTLRVVAFGVPGAANVDVLVNEPTLNNGTGFATRTTVTGGVLTFNFTGHAFTGGTYAPAIDYNQRTPFDPVDLFTFIVQDDARTTLPGSGFINFNSSTTDSTIFITEERSAPATVTITVTEQNDPPIFTMPASIPFIENEGATHVRVDFVTMIAPSQMTALDELVRQNVSFSFTAINVPAGMMSQLPTIAVTTGGPGNWMGSGTLTVFPAADAFGFAVYRVTATDNDPVAPRSTIATLTVQINPINDVPVTYDRALNVIEAVEVDGEVALLSFTPARLIQGIAPELPSVDGLFPTTLIQPYNEVEQTLRVVAFGVPGAANVDVLVNEPGMTGGTGTVSRTTVTGGVLTFSFIGGAFTGGTYAPAINYSERTPFAPVDLFTFIVQDDARTTLPGSGFVNLNSSTTDSTIFITQERSAPATVTITVTEQNDPPIFTMPASIPFIENEGATHVRVDFVTMIAPSEMTALDEWVRQNVSFSFTEINVPAGMMSQLPTIAVTTGGPGNWMGSGTLTVFPAADAFGFAVYLVTATDNDPVDPRTTVATLTVQINPINDVPVAFNRTFIDIEAVEVDGDVTVVNFTAANLLSGSGLETPNVAGNFPITLIAPYNETEQTLRVVAFTIPGVDVIDVVNLPLGTGTVTRTTVNGGQLIFNFNSGAFTSGSYTPATDYNRRTPFAATDLFTYVISDNGRTTLAGSGFINSNSNDTVITLPEERSLVATVTLTILQTNDPPIYDFEPLVNILERDDSGITVVTGWATNILPSELTARDEILRQSVSFSFVAGDSIVPTGLFRSNPQVAPNGTLSLFPAPNAVGTAIIVMRATDFETGSGFLPRSTDATFTVNVQPVNDVPVRDAGQFGTSDVSDTNPDDAWAITSNGTIVYTLRENNTQPGGGTGVDYFIPLNGLNIINAYNQIGLLDVIIVGPPNEADGTPGGSQTLSLNSFPAVTQRGGLLTLTTVGGRAGLNYRPPVNFNFNNGGLDSFTYSVIDNGQTYVPGASPFVDGTLVNNFLTTTGRVELRLNAVNNRPQFVIPATYVEAAEDTDLISTSSFAINILAGPITSPDENSGPNAQTVTFTLNPLNFTRGGANDPFGAGYPEITPFGELTFRPLANAFGIFMFEVLLTDSGSGDASRGDLNTSLTQTITIQVQPINDAPALIANPVSLQYEVLEDRVIDLPIAGLGIEPGLLDNFVVGPPNEAANILPQLGGNQTLELIVPFPPVTAQNGTLVPIRNSSGVLTHLRYTPRQHFVGIDTFSFVAFDNGVTVDVGTSGTSRPDRLSISGSVTINVLPVNDAPLFAGGASVSSAEDQGIVTIANWATAIQAGPAGANDERTGVVTGLPSVTPQTLTFDIIQVLTAGSTVFSPLFISPPVATIVGNNANLSYRTAPDANGTAVFEVILRDNGANDLGRGDVNSTVPRRFTITVGAVNDPPQFTPGLTINVNEVDEVGAEFTFAWSTDIQPGPSTAIDELATQTVSFQVTTPTGSAGLFEAGGLPAIDSNGLLTFTPARDAAGRAVVQVVATDSAGATSTPIFLTINIAEINDVPIANDLTFSGDEDNLLRIQPNDLIAIAVDPDLISNPNEVLSITDLPPFSAAGAAISFDAQGRLVYDPRAAANLQALAVGAIFEDTFTYRLTDLDGAVSNRATITVTVLGINDAPTAVLDSAIAVAGQVVVLRPLTNDFDIDGTLDPASIFITRQPAFGVLVVRNDGTLAYTPSAAFIGDDVIGYTVADDQGQQSEQTTITIRVDRASQGPPTLLAGGQGSGPIVIDAAGAVTPSVTPLDLSSIEILTQPQNGSLIISDDGQITYQANVGFFGSDTFQYRIFDTEGRPSNVITVTVQVVESVGQNPISFRDVNVDSRVEPLDALLVLTRLGRAQREGVVGGLTAEMVFGEVPLRYYDVDGNGLIQPLDALQVLTFIANRQRFGGGAIGGEGEMVPVAAPILAASFANSPPPVSELLLADNEPDEIYGPVTPKVSSFDWADDDLELIAVGVVESRDERRGDSSELELADAVWGDLF